MLEDFDLILGSEDFIDKPRELRELAKKFKVKREDIVYIGDKVSDYKIAKQAGTRVILPYVCSWDKSSSIATSGR